MIIPISVNGRNKVDAVTIIPIGVNGRHTINTMLTTPIDHYCIDFISSVNTPIRMMAIASILFLLLKPVGMMVTLVNRFYFFR
jgi:hypothetical protein